MGTAILNHRVETVHHTQTQTIKIILNIILDQNHLTIIEMEIVHDDSSHDIDFVMLKVTIIHC